MKNGKLKAAPLDNNEYLRYTHCFMTDEAGFCWISTNNGLFKAKLADITDAYEKDHSQIYYHYLGKDDGMETTEMNGGCTPCAIRLKNKNFSFPTMDGLIWFNPEKVTTALPAGDIYIDKLMIDGKQKNITANEDIQFPQRVKKIEITFVTNAWSKKENLYMDYRLNNDDWVKMDIASNEPKISFSNLSYGKYNLVIRKMNGFGANNYSYYTIVFTVSKPYYHQWWFRILAVSLLFGIGWLIFKLRLRQYALREKKLSGLVDEKTRDLNFKNAELEKNDEIKTRLISIINHDIITPLRFMHYSGTALMENMDNIDEEEKNRTIAEITQTATDMERLSSQILNWIIYQNPNERMQKETFNLHEKVEIVFRALQMAAKRNNTKLQNDVPPGFVLYQYPDPMRVLIYNLVMNSLNFTQSGTIRVSCARKDDRVLLTISDSGVGMTDDQVENILSDQKIIASANLDNKKGTGLGYLIIKDLLKIMEGTMGLESEKGKGTVVNILIPNY